MAYDTLRVGVAGLGEAATEFLPDYAGDPRVRLRAAADQRAAARERFESEIKGKAYPTVEELCGDPDIDIVYVSTPHELHHRHVLTALRAGKHVIVEKPMALSVEDCEEMNREAERRGLRILCGHNHSYDAPITRMREIIKSGELGRLCMINTWNFNDFMVRPYPDFALEMSRGVVLNQGPHQVEIVRLLGGGMVRSVRAMAGSWDPTRPGEGAYSCYLEFEDGTPASLVFNGYGFFDTAELFWWIGEGGTPRYPGKHAGSWRNYRELRELAPAERETLLEDLKTRMRYGDVGLGQRPAMPEGWEKGGFRAGGDEPQERHQPFFGLTVVSCEKGDMRQSQDHIQVYGDTRREIHVSQERVRRRAEIDEMYGCLVEGRPLLHSGRWGQATIEVCAAILRSTRERREIRLSHQVPFPD